MSFIKGIKRGLPFQVLGLRGLGGLRGLKGLKGSLFFTESMHPQSV